MFVNIVLILCIMFLVACAMRYIILPALMMCFLIILASIGGIAYGVRMLINAIINRNAEVNDAQ
jgi:hypothetical protein